MAAEADEESPSLEESLADEALSALSELELAELELDALEAELAAESLSLALAAATLSVSSALDDRLPQRYHPLRPKRSLNLKMSLN
ncbi:hypothetical protein [Limosilactobacillus fermentum]|uniref:hypothetical protein n=1 Tax=Limosilactobacillus fermentum TaxID=1613 RepID=UPI001EE13491|nr:hypothetical protein [Limosilactobacillus fermentum]